jgi:hypothetical protein
VLEVIPALAHAPLAVPGSGVDSDVQHDLAPVTPLTPRMLGELAPSLVFAELHLDLPPGWATTAAAISSDGSDYPVLVDAITPQGARYLLARLDHRLELVSVHVLTTGGSRPDVDADLSPLFDVVAVAGCAPTPAGKLVVVTQRIGTDERHHRLALLKSDRKVAATSPPFRFSASKALESCGGLVIHEDELVFSVIVGQAIGLAAVETTDALALLQVLP